ncbi:DNA-binding protein [Microbacterium protaetiae]|uniref:DNA-binding protein n=1 Tax=Microbacterium protaetiae TaxID=2509458 RepID=A0A4P6EDQ5_9MICO|nr:DNA-binding protein [Microbacterium protaetiae]
MTAVAAPPTLSPTATCTVDELARLTGLSCDSASHAVRSGVIPTARLGRRWLVPRARIAEFLHITEEQLDRRIAALPRES